MRRVFLTIGLCFAFASCLGQGFTFRDIAFMASEDGDPKSDSSLLSGLVAYWRMDETTGTREDSTANALHLIPTNDVTFATGKLTNAAEFLVFTQSMTNRLYVSDTSLISLTNTSFTICAWMNCYTNPGSKLGLLSKAGTADDATLEYGIYWDASYWRFVTHDGTTRNSCTISQALVTNTWYFISCWLDIAVGSPTNKFIRVNLGNSGTNYAAAVQDSTNALKIGVFPVGGLPSIQMIGLIDEVGIWNRVLTPRELTNLYNGGSGRTYPF